MTAIVNLLIAERDKLNQAIAALQGGTAKRRGRPPKVASTENMPDWVKPASQRTAPPPPRKKRIFTAAQRKAQGLRMKKFWAVRKAAAKKAAAGA